MAVNKATIAKNTAILYARLIISMIVSLFTSRIILQTLGVSDYGVYNVVGGFVSMMAYMNSVFVDSSQRFITFYLGQGNFEKLKRIFSTSVLVQVIFVAFLFIALETFGLWFVNNKLVISSDRMIAANWVYQCAVGSLLLSILNVPYRACVVAHERMSIYAYISIVEVILRLVIVYLLVVFPADKLIVYAILGFGVSFLIPIWFHIYCVRNFEECRIRFKFDWGIFKEMFSFSGWVLIGNLGFSFKDQFSNILMNQFMGTAINAARGITTQVNGVVWNFANNFLMAMSPQITKQYAIKEYEQSQRLVYSGSKYAFFLMALMIVPILTNIDYLLLLWLGVVPEYTSIFIKISLVSSMYFAMSKPLTVAIQATGDIKWFQIGVAFIMLLELPIAYWVLNCGYSPAWAIFPAIITNIGGILYRLYLLCKGNDYYNFFTYLREVLFQCSILFIVAYAISAYLHSFISDSLLGLLLGLGMSLLMTSAVLFFCGFKKEERNTIVILVKKYVKKRY